MRSFLKDMQNKFIQPKIHDKYYLTMIQIHQEHTMSFENL